MGVLDGGGYRRGDGAVFGLNLGCPIVTSGDFATQLFLNYFGQYLLLLLATLLSVHITKCNYTSAGIFLQACA